MIPINTHEAKEGERKEPASASTLPPPHPLFPCLLILIMLVRFVIAASPRDTASMANSSTAQITEEMENADFAITRITTSRASLPPPHPLLSRLPLFLTAVS